MMNKESITDIYTLDFNELCNEEISVYVMDGMVLVDDIQSLISYINRHALNGRIKVGLNALLLCVKGSIQFMVNDEKVEINPHTLILIPKYSLISRIQMEENTECMVLYLANDVLNHLLGGEVAEWNKIVFHERIKLFKLSEHDESDIKSYRQLIMRQIDINRPYSKAVIRSLIQATLYEILGNCKRLQKDAYSPFENQMALYSNQLFNQFLELLAKSTPKRHPVSYYADKLSISSKYLTILCKKYSGKTAIEWIHEYVLEEIRYYLLQYNLEINKVAELTGFENVSFFSRFVRLHMGCTPIGYRKKVKDL